MHLIWISILIEIKIYITVSGFQFWIADWRQFQIASMIPMLSVVLLFFFLPESPRWQISVGRNEEALKTIRRAERFNKVGLTIFLNTQGDQT